MTLVEKRSEIYKRIEEINKSISELLADYKNFETFNELYTEQERLLKRYNFFSRIINAKVILDV